MECIKWHTTGDAETMATGLMDADITAGGTKGCSQLCRWLLAV